MSLTRRSFFLGNTVFLAALAAPSILRARPRQLALYGPPAGPSITLAHAVAAGFLKDLAEEVTLTTWTNPDELRAGLTSGAMELSVVPVQAAANLYNRGLGLRLVNVMTDGLMTIMAPEGVSGVAALKGKRLAVPFVNDTPDFILRAVLAHHSVADQIEQVAVGSPIEAAQLLLTGRIDAALLSEPASSGVEIMGAKVGKVFARAVDLQVEWGAISGHGAVIPQAGLAVTPGFLERAPELIAPLQAALSLAAASVNAAPEEAAQQAARALNLPAPILAASIPRSNLVARPATAARAQIEAMLSLMAASDAAIIGGTLPDDAFYAL
ncbi:ABC transporter substrate-binding protein [Pseudogemmobacter bohemicus]|uniref:ABC transporter substrate-binding protein n=1 Tax=Pseudogemmobacter bohemicus TaxID=2250708 RepID=UPI000DD38A32|nr:ABC transporter substrate-binding protein [Pseudogemmobacter bohemicus]